jgi:glycosyltransferase involved in cell wall biosynthesis
MQKENGMGVVTITDHNNIGGCLELLKQHDDVFISCEYTTYLPPDRCKFHVLCWNITEKQHEDIMLIRDDIYVFVDYLRKNQVAHGLAHPLFSINGRLTPENFDEVIELFNVFEINAAKDAFSNEYLELILSKAKKQYALTSGSDDHSGLTLSRGHTIVDGAVTVDEFFSAVMVGHNTISCKGSTPHTLARHIYSIALQWLKSSGKVDDYPKILKSYLLPHLEEQNQGVRERIVKNLRKGNPKFWTKNIFFHYLSSKLEYLDRLNGEDLPADQRFFTLIEQSTDKYLVELGNSIVEDVLNYKLLDIFRNAGLALFLYVLLAPYFIAFSIFGAQRKLARQILNRYIPENMNPIRVVKFTDNFGKIDGVSKTLEEQVVEAWKSNKDYNIVTCMGEHLKDLQGVKYFEPIGVFQAPEYSEQPLCWPPIIKILDYCYNEQFNHVQASSPGTMGLLAMLVANTLGLPVHATYHTQIPQFVGEVTGEGFLEELTWRYILWFYGKADVVFAPSEHTREDLINHGLHPSKVKVYPRGVDTEKFHPNNKDRQWLKDTYKIPISSKVFLYVGRVSKEKNLGVLIDAYRKLCAEVPYSHTLVITGEGDFLDELKGMISDLPVVFTGSLEGDFLLKIFASADIFVFPSLRDTHGRVILEAEASGLPCIVSDIGGPCENVLHKENGLIVEGMNGHNLCRAMFEIYNMDTTTMGINARSYAETRSFSDAFDVYWHMYTQISR